MKNEEKAGRADGRFRTFAFDCGCAAGVHFKWRYRFVGGDRYGSSSHQKSQYVSIGFEGNDFFDETPYANLVAKHFKTNHTVFKLKNDDLFESLHELLEYTDEPFADSSALLVNILSKFTRQHVTVALSGDAGDELLRATTSTMANGKRAATVGRRTSFICYNLFGRNCPNRAAEKSAIRCVSWNRQLSAWICRRQNAGGAGAASTIYHSLNDC